jgi:putative spermidine/putrescine transport system permease protein
MVLVVLPIVLVAVTSFSSDDSFQFPPRGLSVQWFARFFKTPNLTAALLLSFEIAFVSATVATCLGFMAAIGSVRTASRRLSALLQAGFLAPLVFPTIVLGLSLLIFYRLVGLNLTIGLVMAHITVSFPYAFRLIHSELQTFDFGLNEAASSLGASPLRGVFYVMLPIVWPGLLSGWVFGFIVSLGELNTSLFLTGPAFTTLPIEMFSYLQFEGAQLVIAAASTMQIAAVLCLFILVQIIRRFSASQSRVRDQA